MPVSALSSISNHHIALLNIYICALNDSVEDEVYREMFATPASVAYYSEGIYDIIEHLEAVDDEINPW
jgi:hypothetical protein